MLGIHKLDLSQHELDEVLEKVTGYESEALFSLYTHWVRMVEEHAIAEIKDDVLYAVWQEDRDNDMLSELYGEYSDKALKLKERRDDAYDELQRGIYIAWEVKQCIERKEALTSPVEPDRQEEDADDEGYTDDKRWDGIW